MLKRLALLLLVNFVFATASYSSGTAFADTWTPPSTQVYHASNKRFRLTVTPREIGGALDYFEGLQNREKKPGQRPGSTQTFARGVLERSEGHGRWMVVWDMQMVNDVAPVTALVADSGSYIVTFDNWHFVGFGDNVVVIYDAKGRLIRSLKLDDILPADYIKALPRSVSSIDWNGKHRFEESQDLLVLQIVVPSGKSYDPDPAYVERRVRLSTGQVLPSNDPAWAEAMAKASRVAKANKAAEEAADAAFRAPLLGPATTTDADWHDYLREAFYRLDADWEESYPNTKVLRAPNAADYMPSQTWLREAFLEEALEWRVLMVASPSSPDNLVKVLTSIAREMKPNAPHGARIYVAVPATHRDGVAAALAPTGVTFIHLDPAKPIPQRPERLKRRFSEDEEER